MDEMVKDIVDFWGESLKIINISENEKNKLSKETELFFKKVGTPIDNKFLINFNDSITEYRHEGKENNYVMIGNDFGTSICINIKTDEIFSIDDDNELPVRFINSNIKCLLGCLMVYIKYQPQLIEADDEEVFNIVKEIRESFIKFDLRALENDENWWSVILEQIEYGLM